MTSVAKLGTIGFGVAYYRGKDGHHAHTLRRTVPAHAVHALSTLSWNWSVAHPIPYPLLVHFSSRWLATCPFAIGMTPLRRRFQKTTRLHPNDQICGRRGTSGMPLSFARAREMRLPLVRDSYATGHRIISAPSVSPTPPFAHRRRLRGHRRCR